MRKMLRLAVVILVVTVVPNVWSGGSNQSGSVSGRGTASLPAGPVSLKDYTPKVSTLAIQTNNRLVPDGNRIQKWLEENMKVKLEFTILDGNELRSKLTLLAASNTLPDLMTLPSNLTDVYMDFAGQGVFANLDPLLPVYGQNIVAARTKDQIEALRYMDGNLYALNSNIETDFDMLLIRQDWLDKLGLKVPETIDDLYNVAKAFKERDPDGNGANDTEGYFAWGSLFANFSAIWAAFNANPSQWVWQGNTIVHGYTQPQLKEALKFLHKMYADGLIPREYMTIDLARKNAEVSAGHAGILEDQAWYVDPEYSVFHQSSGAKWVAIPKLKGPGEGGYLTAGNPQVRQFTVINARSKDPALAMLYLDFIAQRDNLLIIRSGWEGEHYTWNNGKVVMTPKYQADNSLLIQEGITATYGMPFFSVDPIVRDPAADSFIQMRRQVEKDFYGAMYWPVPEIVDNQLNAGMGDYVNQVLNNCIMNNVNIDVEIDRMVNELKARYNLDRQTAAVNAYAKYLGFTPPR
jgi:ABC-type glycerol-3-phosphate transport system substrate-binding protein